MNDRCLTTWTHTHTHTHTHIYIYIYIVWVRLYRSFCTYIYDTGQSIQSRLSASFLSSFLFFSFSFFLFLPTSSDIWLASLIPGTKMHTGWQRAQIGNTFSHHCRWHHNQFFPLSCIKISYWWQGTALCEELNLFTFQTVPRCLKTWQYGATGRWTNDKSWRLR